jgi:hypothetical protein
MSDLEKCIAEIEFRFPCVRDHEFTSKEWQTLKSAVLAQQTNNKMTFEEWWYHGCRYGEHEPHKFASDMPSDAWIAKEAWQAATENAEAEKPSHKKPMPKLPTLAECQAHVQREIWGSRMLANSVSITESVYNLLRKMSDGN